MYKTERRTPKFRQIGEKYQEYHQADKLWLRVQPAVCGCEGCYYQGHEENLKCLDMHDALICHPDDRHDRRAVIAVECQPPEPHRADRMRVEAMKLTTPWLARRACTATLGGRESKISMQTLYRSEHSPIRTQIFWIEMFNIPSFVSVHLVRHKIGVEHFVESKRDDRGGQGNEDRNAPVEHFMLINAQALVTMAHARLCGKAHEKTNEVMQMIKEAVGKVDPDLGSFMVRKCLYLSGCVEPVSCPTDRHEEAVKELDDKPK